MKILYMLNEFPLVTENFIFYEIQGFIKRGAKIKIFSIAPVAPEKRSEVPKNLGFEDKAVFRKSLSVNKFYKLYRVVFLLLRLVLRGNLKAVKLLLRDKETAAEFSRYILLETARQVESAHDAPDIIHCHFGTMGRLAAVLKHYNLVTAKVVTIFHGYDVSGYLQKKPDGIYDTLFRTGDYFICVSDFFLERIRSLGAPVDRSATIHTAIDCRDFEFIPRALPKSGTVRFICVGRLTEKKGHRYLVDAFAKLCAAYPKRDFYLDLIGGGELTEEIAAKIKSLGLEDNIILYGAVQHTQVRDLLKQAHVFVLHSIVAESGDTEGIPGSLMEAMAQGLPVISTYHTGIPELIEHGVSGLLGAEKDVDALFEQMQTLIDTPKLWEPMTSAARAKVEVEFEREVVSDQLFSLFEGVGRS